MICLKYIFLYYLKGMIYFKYGFCNPIIFDKCFAETIRGKYVICHVYGMNWHIYWMKKRNAVVRLSPSFLPQKALYICKKFQVAQTPHCLFFWFCTSFIYILVCFLLLFLNNFGPFCKFLGVLANFWACFVCKFAELKFCLCYSCNFLQIYGYLPGLIYCYSQQQIRKETFWKHNPF